MVFVGVDYALLLVVEETIRMILDDADGGPVLELSLHYVEIKKSPRQFLTMGSSIKKHNYVSWLNVKISLILYV